MSTNVIQISSELQIIFCFRRVLNLPIPLVSLVLLALISHGSGGFVSAHGWLSQI